MSFPNVAIGLILVLAALATLHGSPVYNTQDNNSNNNIREQKSKEILKYLNNSVDPCEDFYEFTCGNYSKDNMPDGFAAWSVLSNIYVTFHSKVTKELTSSIEATDTPADKKVKRFYAVCMNTSKIGGGYINQLKEFISEFGKMPLLEGDQWKADEFDWMKLMADIKHKTDIGIIMNAKVVPDFTNNSINRVALTQPDFFYTQAAYYTDEAFEEHQEIFRESVYLELVSHLGVEEEEALKTASEIYQFEVALAQAMQDVEMTPPSDLYALIDIDDMQKKYLSAWDSRKLFKAALDLEPSRVMIQPSYLKNVFKVIQNTPKRVVANYIFYNYLKVYTTYLPSYYTDMESNCVGLTDKYFQDNLQNMVYRKYFIGGQEKELVDTLWQELKVTFEEILKSPRLNWINSDNTRQNAVEKLRAMKLKIDDYQDIDFDQKLAELNIDDHDMLRNIRAVLEMCGNHARRRMNQPPQFKMAPNFSPSYTIEENVIHLPIALLQADMPWSLSYPYAINFGSLGFYIGHEMLHGYDDSGRYYDSSGSCRDWWDSVSVREHEERIKCFARQYRSYSFGGRQLPDIKRQAENISDNGGLHLVYKAYQKWQQAKASAGNQEPETLKGLNFTNNQLFFISYSQAWCKATSPDYTYTMDYTEIHVPANLRVIGTLSNFEEFAKSFNCPKGSPMNPLEKCQMY